MGDSKRNGVMTPKDKIEVSRQHGWSAFVAKAFAGEEPTTADCARALHGLSAIIGQVDGSVAKTRDELTAVIARVDRDADATRTGVEAGFDAARKAVVDLDRKVARNSILAVIASENLRRVRRWLEAELDYRQRLAEWNALSWWTRRKTPRPEAPVVDGSSVMIPDPEFSPIAGEPFPPDVTFPRVEEPVPPSPLTVVVPHESSTHDSLQSTGKACVKCGDTGRIADDIPCDCSPKATAEVV